MASYEFIYGDRAENHAHMVGLQTMVGLRGGVNCLGLDGLMKRALLWVDKCQAMLTGRPHYLPQPNPVQGTSENLESQSILLDELGPCAFLLDSRLSECVGYVDKLANSLSESAEQNAKAIETATADMDLSAFMLKLIRLDLGIPRASQSENEMDIPDDISRTVNECVRLGTLAIARDIVQISDQPRHTDPDLESHIRETLLQINLVRLAHSDYREIVFWMLFLCGCPTLEHLDLLTSVCADFVGSRWQHIEQMLKRFLYSPCSRPRCFKLWQTIEQRLPESSNPKNRVAIDLSMLPESGSSRSPPVFPPGGQGGQTTSRTSPIKGSVVLAAWTNRLVNKP